MAGKQVAETAAEPLARPLAHEPRKQPLDPDLARILEAWPKLPEPIRRAMLALIECDQ